MRFTLRLSKSVLVELFFFLLLLWQLPFEAKNPRLAQLEAKKAGRAMSAAAKTKAAAAESGAVASAGAAPAAAAGAAAPDAKEGEPTAKKGESDVDV